jgi:uncharacterized repeat protein (TIGR03803 family)
MDKLNWWLRAVGALLLWATAAVALPAQTFTTLHSFDQTDGANPEAALVQATNGNLYGTTLNGGNGGYRGGSGTVFKITPSGVLTTLHSFNLTEGAYPYAGLVQATNGKLYGTTYDSVVRHGGTVFKITLRGKLTTVYNFGQTNTDGAYPYAGLVQATNGNLYGTTSVGGTNFNGTVFKITPSGKLTTLYSFCAQFSCFDGKTPYAELVQGIGGKLYGTTYEGGHGPDYGTIFSVTAGGMLTPALHSFDYTHGAFPSAGLVQGTDGDFYGTTSGDGTNGSCNNENGCGTVFKINPDSRFTTLYNFCSQSGCADGAVPYAGLVQGTDGNFYGTTEYGGAGKNNPCSNAGCGTVFKITPNGTLTILYTFCLQSGCPDGSTPLAALVQDTNGEFYGTTSTGGNIACEYGCGTVFSLSVGLGPFVKTQPTSGTVGAAVIILGTNLTGATSVIFNGTAATLTVVSASEITTTVPTGATTGTVQVVTPGGTLSSNVPFRVN